MTDPSLIAASIVTVIVALTGATVTVLSKLKEIHMLVNGSATLAKEKLELLEKEITSLHLQMDALQERRVEDAKTREAGQK